MRELEVHLDLSDRTEERRLPEKRVVSKGWDHGILFENMAKIWGKVSGRWAEAYVT